MKKDRTEVSKTGRSRGEIIFYLVAALVALVGLTEATYLTVVFLSGETAVCGNSPDCFKVLGSAYAKIGPIPVSALGALAYFSVFSFAIFSAFDYNRARRFF